MRILVSGSHGLVGKALIDALEKDGHEISRLVRYSPHSPDEVEWNPDRYSIAIARLEGFDAVVNLAGESIAEGRWTTEKKSKIRESRVTGTKLLGDALANLDNKPKTFICASAIGYYGNRGDELLTETSAPGDDFLSRVCVDWEQSTSLAADNGIRVVNARFGVILDTEGGALKKMLPPFRMGVGGKLGNGKQWMSWIALDDVVAALKFALNTDALHGPVNFVAPNPVSNAEFTKALGKALNRPTLFPVPAFAVKLMFGEMGEALLLGGQRVKPARLINCGFSFRSSQIDEALRKILERNQGK